MTISRYVLASSIGAIIYATVGLAQVRQVQMGGAMDANPLVGSGGTNRPIPGYVPVNGNDIMTGNVSGLAYFHAPVGTVNQYQFRGSLGSASLDTFMRQSAGSPGNYGTYLGLTQPYYLPSSTVSTGAAGFNPIPTGSGFDSALVPRTAYSPLISGAEIRSITGADPYSGMTGSGSYGVIHRETSSAVAPGSPGALLANPIFTLRTTELPTTRPDIGVRATGPASMPAAGFQENGTGDTGENKPPENPAMIRGEVGGEMQSRITGKSGDLKTAMVSDNYLKVAQEIKTLQGFETPGAENKEPGTAASAGVSEIDPLTGLPRRMTTVPPPALNGRGGLVLGGGATTQGMGPPPAAVVAPPPKAKRLNELTDNELQAGAKIKPVRIAAMPQLASSVSSYDLLMQRAEKNLADGRFMDAAESYQNALALKPADPLALVGRAHAYLGAGIYAGAEYDLKFVFTRNPSLVGLKYQDNSFVPAARQEYLLEDLQKATGKTEMANMASFLYCYICYETGRTEPLNAELKRWGEREGHDEWQNVAARAWGGAK